MDGSWYLEVSATKAGNASILLKSVPARSVRFISYPGSLLSRDHLYLTCFQTSAMKTAVVLVCLIVAVVASPQFGLGNAGANSFQRQHGGLFGGGGFQGGGAHVSVSTTT